MEKRPRRGRIAAVVVVSLAFVGLAAGAAAALLGGLLSGINLATGVASGQAQPCQTDAVDFEFVEPQWNGNAQAFNISQISFRNFSTTCVDSGASLSVVVVAGNTEFLDTVFVPNATTGTIELTTPLNSTRAPDAQINYLVQG